MNETVHRVKRQSDSQESASIMYSSVTKTKTKKDKKEHDLELRAFLVRVEEKITVPKIFFVLKRFLVLGELNYEESVHMV